MQTINIDLEKINEAKTEIELFTQEADSVVVKSHDDYESAGSILKKIKDKSRDLEALRKTITSPLDTAKKAVMDLFRKPQDALESAERKIKSAMVTYVNEEDRKKREAQRKLDEEARRKEEAERAKLEKKAVKAEEKGDAALAEELRDQKQDVYVPATQIAVEQPKADGVKMREDYDFIIINELEIPRAMNGMRLLVPDEKVIRQLVKSSKGTVQIPGVRIIKKKIVAA